MNRRTTLIAPVVALGGLALPALFKTNTAFAADADPDTVKLPLAAYKRRLLSYGTLSIETSQIAAAKSTNALVVGFAQHEVLEQTTIGQSITNMAAPPPAKLNPEQTAQLAQVQQATPDTFDAVYLAVQLGGHKKLHAYTTSFLSGTIDYSSDLVHISLIAHAFIQNHIYLLEQLIAEGA